MGGEGEDLVYFNSIFNQIAYIQIKIELVNALILGRTNLITA